MADSENKDGIIKPFITESTPPPRVDQHKTKPLKLADLFPGAELKGELEKMTRDQILELINQREDLNEAYQENERNKHTQEVLLDPLTGLYSKTSLDRRLNEAYNAGVHGTNASVIFIDTDKFKLVNDITDHTTADKLLIRLSEIFRSCVRESDVVARRSGDEFVIVLEGANQNAAAIIAERIRSEVEEHKLMAYGSGPRAGETAQLTISAGVASLFNEDGKIQFKDALDFLTAADGVVKSAKNPAPTEQNPHPTHGNRVCLYTGKDNPPVEYIPPPETSNTSQP
jgi:diguanylate cyclase (GGDEF)-like protein